MDLQHLRASDGTGEAVLAHIQTPRTVGSTVLDVDNVDNWPQTFTFVTGTPAANGFISPSGMKVMYGHLSAGDIIIDGYAPGYSDNGNTTSEVAIVKMTTSWADALVTLLSNALADTGFLKTTSLDHFFKPAEISPTDFIASGGIVAQTAGLTGSFSNIVFYIAGLRYSKTGVANKNYTASKDTYVDIDSTGTVYYTEVANGATTGFALTAGRLRVAKVVTSGAAITSIVQTGRDALNNILANRDPNLFQGGGAGIFADSANWGPGGGTVVVPNTTSTIITRGGRIVVFFQATKVFLTAGSATFRVYVDGVDYGEFARCSNSNGATSGMIVLNGITAGSHTFDVRHNNSGGSTQLIQFNGQSACYFEIGS